MVEGPYLITIVLDDTTNHVAQEVIDECAIAGFFDENYSVDYHHASTVEEIVDSGEGLVRLRYDGGFDHELLFDLADPDWQGIDGIVTLSMDAAYLDENDGDPDAIRSFIDSLIDLIKRLVRRTNPVYVYSVGTQTSTNDFHRGIVPQDPSNTSQFSHIPWLGVYAPETVEAFGGYDHVLAAPAERVEKLESGHVLIVATDSPWAVPDHSLESYLLGPD